LVVVGQVGQDEAGDLALLPQLLVVGRGSRGPCRDERLQPVAGGAGRPQQAEQLVDDGVDSGVRAAWDLKADAAELAAAQAGEDAAGA
jgi:hypothetical protein